MPQYGDCRTFFLDHDEMKTKRLVQIFLYFKANKNRIMVVIQDNERVLIKRGLKAESDSYDGVHIEFDLENPMNRKYFISMKQNIHLEMESGINGQVLEFNEKPQATSGRISGGYFVASIYGCRYLFYEKFNAYNFYKVTSYH